MAGARVAMTSNAGAPRNGMALWSGRFERDRTGREGRRCQDWDRRRGLKGERRRSGG